ncbi:MAG TPA: adenylate/guanylate cyclase domain-containing protein [Terriglobia bacterium]|nr:adenylate/guanylate cyclase domain-containing protein [Terriglobia bacterium]
MNFLRRWIKSKIAQALALGLASGLLVLGAWSQGLFVSQENKSLDWRFRTLTKPGLARKDIIIIAVDDQSFDTPSFLENFGRYPPRRQLYAALVHYLNEWGAKAIGFDIFFQGTDPHAGDDGMFAQALGERKDVVLGFTLNNSELDPPARKLLEKRLDPFKASMVALAPVKFMHYSGADLPEDLFSKVVPSLGCASVVSDPDGPVRRMSPIYSFENQFFPSLSLAVANLASGKPAATPLELQPGPALMVAGRPVPLDSHGQMMIRWYGPAHTFKHYSAWRVINAALDFDNGQKPEIPPETFKNKIVLIAVTAVGAGDVRPTAFSDTYPGVEIHATLIQNFLNGDFLYKTSSRDTVVFVLLMALLMAGMVYSFDSALTYSLLSLGVGLTYFAICCWEFEAHNLWMPMVAPLTAGVIAFTGPTLTRYATEGREKRKYRKTLIKYISPSLVETIMADMDWASLRAEKRNLTVLFSDIRGFTSISEKLPAEIVIKTLNEHLNMMVSVIFDHQGTLDKFVGDCVMAFWGAPFPQPNHAELAARSALAMIKGLEKLNKKWQSEGRPTLQIGVGVNTGEMLFGNIGSEQRMDFTVIGDSVNLGSRLESATKELHASIVISDSTFQLIRDLAEVRPLGEISVKGKAQKIVVYELLGMADTPRMKEAAL